MAAWIRLYTSVAHDPKVQQLPPATFKAWITLLCLVGENDRNSGEIPSHVELNWALRFPDEEVEVLLTSLIDAGLLERWRGKLFVHNWSGRQYKSDSSAERMRASRQRHTRRGGDGSEPSHVTPTDRHGDAPRTEQIRDRSEQNRSDSLRVPPAPRLAPGEYIDRFFQATNVNEQVAAIIDLWGVPLSEKSRGHLGRIIKANGHGQAVANAAKAAIDAKGDPAEVMERVLGNEKARRSAGSRAGTAAADHDPVSSWEED